MNHIEEYKRKIISLEEALSHIKSNDTVVVAMAASQPQGFLSNLHLIRNKVENVKLISCLILKEYEFLKQAQNEDSAFVFESWYMGGYERGLYKKGLLKYIPNNLHRAAVDKIASEKIDVFIGTATPIKKGGFFSLSLNLVYEKEMIENAKTVILEINENLPEVYGDTEVHISDVDYILEYNAPLIEVSTPEATELERKIGEYIAELIENGSTIQLGIGGIPNAITKFITHKSDLGVHTEMITEGMVDLIELGVVNNSKKTLFKGKTIGTFAMGTKKLYDFINKNLALELHRGNFVNNPYVVSQNEKMVSINTSLSIDLTGQVSSESFGYEQYTGTGGQLDMHRGATISKGGKGIIALRSSVKNDTISTIVPMLPQGTYITVPRQDVDYVVTEYGIAHLRGKSVKERALELIKIAHPNFKEYLVSEAKKMNLI